MLILALAFGCADSIAVFNIDDSGSNPGQTTPITTGPPAPATCGNAQVDAGEDCDDGNAWFADGCTPDCVAETGPFEAEPNETWSTASSWVGEPLLANLPDGDIDCFAITELGDCDTMSAEIRLLGPEDSCDGVQMSVFGTDGTELLPIVAPKEGECPRIDPNVLPEVRFAIGPLYVCVSSPTELRGYTFDAQILSSEPFREGTEPDLDGDGRPDTCDQDLDGDGVDNAVDNCPDFPNGPDAAPLTPSAEGFIRDWIVLGPRDSGVSTCAPSVDEADEDLAPRIGEADGNDTWRFYRSATDYNDLNADLGNDAGEEIYLHSYFYTPITRVAFLALGADDGVRVFLDGAEVFERDRCQVATVDRFNVAVQLGRGWHTLTLKVHNWLALSGVYVRFLTDKEAPADREPILDLELGISPDETSIPDQSDFDMDGIGDVCDSEPGSPAPAP